MSDIAARCRECGYEQLSEFAPCPVCGAAASAWWCCACREWRDTPLCFSCGDTLSVPRQIELGQFPPGASVPVHFEVRNPGKKPLDFSVAPGDLLRYFPGSRRTLRAGEATEVHGTLRLGRFPPGRREFKVRFEATNPVETTLIVDVISALVRVEFNPAEVMFRNAAPGKILRRTMELKNRGNVTLALKLQGTAPWLSVAPGQVELTSGATTVLAITAKTRRTHFGEHLAAIRVEAEGNAWEVPVTVRLPEPKVGAVGPSGIVSELAAVDLGTIPSDGPTYTSLTLRNSGKVRAPVTLVTDSPWLAVTPKRVNLAVGGEKVVKLRAVSPESAAVSVLRANVSVLLDEHELLRVPVVALWHPPKPILAPIRKQTLGAVANDAPIVRGFRVANSGDGRLVCEITALAPWVEILTPRLEVGAGKKRRVEFRMHTAALPFGKNTTVIAVRSSGGNHDVPVSVEVVEPRPVLEVSPEVELELPPTGGPAEGHILVRNVGVGMLRVQAEAENSRVTVSREVIAIAPGPPVKLPVTAATAGLPGGDYSARVRFTSNGGSGVTELRLRLPIESLELPGLIEMGACVSGRWKSDSLRLRNMGNTAVTLRLSAEPKWLRLETDRVTVRPGELSKVPFSVELPSGLSGRIRGMIHVEGRTLRHDVEVWLMARIINVAVKPQALDLGDLKRGAEREVALEVENKGDLPARIRRSHAAGPLEVWVPADTVDPGMTGTIVLRVRLNSGEIGKHLRVMVPLTEEQSVRLTVRVVRARLPRLLAVLAAGSCLLVGVALGVTESWFAGVATAGAGLLAAGGCLLLSDG